MKSASILRRPSNTPGLSEKTGAINVQIGVSRPETVSTQEGRDARVPKGFFKQCGGIFAIRDPPPLTRFSVLCFPCVSDKGIVT